MASNSKTLPLFFREIESTNKILLSNQSGSFAFIENRQQLKEIISGNIETISTEKIEELFAKNFICEEQEYAVRTNLIASNFASRIHRSLTSPSLFMIVPTLRCDHDCRYCQVSRVPLDRQGYDLHAGRIEKILSFINQVPSKRIKIEFQGGEPLHAFDFIKQFVEKAKQVLSDKQYALVICSALGPLDEEKIAWAKANSVDFSVSLDGPEHLHNANRPSKYFNPYQNTITNIKKLQNELGADKVNCLATASKTTLNYASELADTYFDLGFQSLFIRPLSPFGFATLKMDQIYYSPEEYFSFYTNCLKRVIELNSRRLFIEESALIHLNKIFKPDQSGYVDLQSPSGYLFGAMVFNYDGNVFGSDEARMLWETTKSPELVLGNIDNDQGSIFTNGHAVTLLSDTFISSTPGCDECAYQPFCGADPLHHLSAQGDHVGNKAISFFCKLQRMMFDHIFHLLETDKAAQKVFHSWLHQ